MANKLTSLTGFGEGDPKPEKTKKDVFKAPGHSRRLTHRTITDDAGGRTVQFGGRANYHRGEAKSKALSKKLGQKQRAISKTTRSGDVYFDRLHKSKEHKDWRGNIEKQYN